MEPANEPVPAEQIEALRAFNHFYTQRIGVLAPYPGSNLSLTEVRVLVELAQHAGTGRISLDATRLGAALGLDAGYLSRILRRFETRAWIRRSRSPVDARLNRLELTRAGRSALVPLQRKSAEHAAALLQPLHPRERIRLAGALAVTHRLLNIQPSAAPVPTVVLRDPLPGDLGWVVQQHGAIYAREFGWDLRFEGMVADIAARFMRDFQPERERCWIAAVDGQTVGSVFLVCKSKRVAQLRMLILVPEARGLGVGAQLTDACITFARQKGYHKLVLWTNSCLTAARALYEKRGFKLVRSEPYQGFGLNLVGEHWELPL